jgi:hypothetical protein
VFRVGNGRETQAVFVQLMVVKPRNPRQRIGLLGLSSELLRRLLRRYSQAPVCDRIQAL